MLATVMSLVIVLVGGISLLRLPDRELPDVDPPVVSVTTIYEGAAPEVVETSITQPLEDELMGIEGSEHITAMSREQVSEISIEFALSRDVDVAASDVRDRVARVRGELPDDIEDPVVAKQESDASPIMWVALSSERHDPLELTTLAETRLQDRLAKLEGVSSVILAGERRYSMRVWIDNTRLTAVNLTVADVRRALAAENVDLPSGRIEGPTREFTVRTLGELRSPEGYGELVVAERDGEVVRLRDVARVEAGPESERSIVRFSQRPAVALGIVKQSKANTVAVADAVKAELGDLRTRLSPGMRLEIAWDQSVFIRRSIQDVTGTIAEAIALVILVIYLFLRSFRATLVPAVAIPVSVIGAFAFLEVLGFSINTLTLMGLTLAIGLVVDDAIVVLENVTRWVESGVAPREAAHRGMKEISFAILTATLSVIAVFLPLAFLSDQTGRLFREFGVTVASAVAISGFVALTMAPMLSARILRPAREETGVKARLEQGLARLTAGYQWALRRALSRSGLAVLAGLAWFGLGLVLLQVIPEEFVPTADRGGILIITEAPEGSTVHDTNRYQREVERIVFGVPEVDRGFSVVGYAPGTPGPVNRGAMFAMLEPWEERERSQQTLVDELVPKLHQVAGMEVFPLNPPSLGQRFGASPVSLVIQGPDVERLAAIADEVMRRAEEIPGLMNLRSDLVVNKPQLLVTIDRGRAADLGVSVREIASTLQILLGGLDLSTFKLGGETYDVIVQLEEDARATPHALLELYVHNAIGDLIPLQSVVEVEEATAPRGLPHFDRLRSATVSASLEEGRPLGEALERIRALAEAVIGDESGYRVTFSGESEDFYESGNALAFAYLLAVLIVFLLLSAQFESFVHPVTIMIAVALSFTGALVMLLLVGDTLNLFSQIGLVMLIGLVTKNSILIVEFANQLRERGRDPHQAAFEAATARFRPILMTAVSTIVGILPIALGTGAGGEARAPLGVAVAGGMLFSTGFTLFVVPAAYELIERGRERLTRSAPAGELAGAPDGPSA